MDLADIIRWISKNHIAAILAFVVVSALWEWISKQIARGRTPPPNRSRRPADPVLRPSAEPAPPTQVPTPAVPRRPAFAKPPPAHSTPRTPPTLRTLSIQTRLSAPDRDEASTSTSPSAPVQALTVATRLWRTRAGFREALIAHEVLGPPRSLRD